MTPLHGLRFAIGTLTILPVRLTRVDRDVAGHAMALAPAVGLLLAAIASIPLAALTFLNPGPTPNAPGILGAALAVGTLAVLTRGLHLDGLADLADGLGSGKPAPQALEIMKQSDIGPFGVMTLVLVLLIQTAALAETGWPALVAACVTGRLAITWACRFPAARPDGLGALVAGTVRPMAAWSATLASLLTLAALGLAVPHPALTSVILPIAMAFGLLAAFVLRRHATRRLGGITGDVLGALSETATTATLLACALLS